MKHKGVAETEEVGRVKPESDEQFHKFCTQAFGSGQRALVLMTDGAWCYRCRCDACAARMPRQAAAAGAPATVGSARGCAAGGAQHRCFVALLVSGRARAASSA